MISLVTVVKIRKILHLWLQKSGNMLFSGSKEDGDFWSEKREKRKIISSKY